MTSCIRRQTMFLATCNSRSSRLLSVQNISSWSSRILVEAKRFLRDLDERFNSSHLRRSRRSTPIFDMVYLGTGTCQRRSISNRPNRQQNSCHTIGSFSSIETRYTFCTLVNKCKGIAYQEQQKCCLQMHKYINLRKQVYNHNSTCTH